MKLQIKTLAIILLVLLITLACNMPGSGAPPAVLQGTVAPVTEAPSTDSPLPAATEEVALPASTTAPADLPFNIDCSALDASKQERCDTFIAQTRDVIYPLYRELTGTSLSKCYGSVNYTILPGDSVAPGAGGLAMGENIQYAAQYSVDLPYKYDTHELLHTFAACNGALDGHVFHGVFINAAYSRLGISEPGYFISRDNPADLNSALVEMVKTSSGDDLYNQCRGILSNHIILGYFDLGESPMIEIYKATMARNSASAPSPTLAAIWGGADAPAVQIVLDKLDELKYPLDVPACGY